jgi:hypothetical protein
MIFDHLPESPGLLAAERQLGDLARGGAVDEQQLRAALRVAMLSWGAWVDVKCGGHPVETRARHRWLLCERALGEVLR